jgi:hypothetical protein
MPAFAGMTGKYFSVDQGVSQATAWQPAST